MSFLTHPYPPSVKEGLLRLIGSVAMEGAEKETEGPLSVLRNICAYNAIVGRGFADAAKCVVSQAGVDMCDIAIIGSHG